MSVSRLLSAQQVRPGKIYFESPIAQALIGKKTGDTVTISSPAGSYDVKILSVAKTK